MIQDIFPSKLHNEYQVAKASPQDYLLFYNEEGKVYVSVVDGQVTYPQVGQEKGNMVYLFALDDKKYFMARRELDKEREDFAYWSPRELRDQVEGKEIFAIFTAYHLWKWYRDNRFCGACGQRLDLGKKERSLVCPTCGHVVYPRINPAVIVAVTKGDYILLTKYQRGIGYNALVAGFTEIGETLEETVEREVMEETGLKVKNIRYYKSQPWGLAQDILAGFVCQVDGDDQIHMDERELRYAQWVRREDVELQPNNLSLTNEMMRKFKEGNL
ncbi:MAG: NAD(+) diphosphatase [Eubacterium sp.]|nr:NAD(+) diphosphatase [Eubacterium sp.]